MTDLHCPICDRQLVHSGDPNVFYCNNPTDEWDIGEKEYVIWIDKDGDFIKILDLLPYTFTLTKIGEKRNTKVRVLTYKAFPDKEIILDVPSVIDFPWHDKDQVFEKLKLYLTFS